MLYIKRLKSFEGNKNKERKHTKAEAAFPPPCGKLPMPSSFPSTAMASSSSSTSENPRISDHLALATAPISGRVAVTACAAMAFFYVAILYSPTLILRLPPPASLESFMIRRFACAVVSSAVSVISCLFLLGVSRLSFHLLLPPRFNKRESDSNSFSSLGDSTIFQLFWVFLGSGATTW